MRGILCLVASVFALLLPLQAVAQQGMIGVQFPCAPAAIVEHDLTAQNFTQKLGRVDLDEDVWVLWENVDGRWVLTLTIAHGEFMCRAGMGGDWSNVKPGKGA